MFTYVFYASDRCDENKIFGKYVYKYNIILIK